MEMAYKLLKTCSISYVIREMQIKIRMRCHQTPMKMAKIQNTDYTKCHWGRRATRMVIHGLRNAKRYSQFGRQFDGFLKKQTNIFLSYDPATVLPDTSPEELKTHAHTKTCTGIFTSAVFRNATTWKQPGYPSGDEWINKLWYIKIMGYYLH